MQQIRQLLRQNLKRGKIIAKVIESYPDMKVLTVRGWVEQAKKENEKTQDADDLAELQAEAARLEEEKRWLHPSRENIKELYWKMSRADVRKMYFANGSPKKIHELDDETAAGLLSVNLYEGTDPKLFGTILSFRFANRKTVLDSLSRLEGFNLPPGEGQLDDEADLENAEIIIE